MALGDRRTRTTPLGDLLDAVQGTGEADPAVRDTRVVPTGFRLVDDAIGGGLRSGDLVLLGGPPGVGKTVAALQMAREVACRARPVLYACYEHDEADLAARLLLLETASLGRGTESGRRVADLLRRGAPDADRLAQEIDRDPGLQDALAHMRGYGDRLTLVRASGRHTVVEELDFLVDDLVAAGRPPVLFVDYLQKIPVQPEPASETEKATRTVEALKDLALAHRVPVVATSAIDAEGMSAPRHRLHHLRGSSAIAFEADVVIMLSEKARAVSKVHVVYDPVRARQHRDWVVFSIEKNRVGPAPLDLEFRKDFTHFRFDPRGGVVTEELVDERLDDAAR